MSGILRSVFSDWQLSTQSRRQHHLQWCRYISTSHTRSTRLLYDGLHHDQFRLLRVLPEDRKSATIKCTLKPEPLKNPPQYEALSYAWSHEVASELQFLSRQGSTTYATYPDHGYGPQNILVNGHNFTATNTLYFARKRLRLPREPRNHLGQPDLHQPVRVDERNRQVRHMKRIYAHADDVLIWLGKHDTMSRFAMLFLGTLIPSLEQESFVHGDTGLGHKMQTDRDFHAGVSAVHSCSTGRGGIAYGAWL